MSDRLEAQGSWGKSAPDRHGGQRPRMKRPKKMRILLVEDDVKEVARFKDYFKNVEDAEISGIAGSPAEALRLARFAPPDAVVLDLELREGDGTGFLDGIKAMDLPYRPFILTTTRTSSPITLQFVRRNGSDFIIDKMAPGYEGEGPRIVLDFLRKMRPHFDDPLTEESGALVDVAAERRKNLRHAISRELGEIGIYGARVGHKYIVEAILLGIDRPDCMTDMTNYIYPSLRKKFQATTGSMERAMRTCIESAWLNVPPDVLEEHYTQYIDPDKGKPELTDFLAFFVEKYR